MSNFCGRADDSEILNTLQYAVNNNFNISWKMLFSGFYYMDHQNNISFKV